MADKKEYNTDKITKWLNDCRALHSKDADKVLSEILSLFGKYFQLAQGIAFVKNKETKKYEQVATYAFIYDDNISFKKGEGITGQAVKNKEMLVVRDIPVKYFTALSGLGNTKKLELLIIPLIANEEVEAVVEMAFFKLPDEAILKNIETAIMNCYFSKVSKKNDK